MGIMKGRTVALAAAVAASLAFSSPASAQLLTFSTTGTFGGACVGTTSCTIGGYTLGFTGVTNASYSTLPRSVSLGEFLAITPTTDQGLTSFAGASFTLNIIQSVPQGGSSGVTGTVSGTFQYTSGGTGGSGLVWVPASDLITITTPDYVTTFDLRNLDGSVDKLIPGDRDVSLEAVANVAPEPGTFVLLGSGLVGLVGIVRRRRKMQEA